MCTPGDKILYPSEHNHINIFVSLKDSNKFTYLSYNTETGRSQQWEARMPVVMEVDPGGPGAGERIRCLRERRSGEVVRRHGDLVVYRTQEGEIHVTHRLFSILHIDTEMCNKVKRGEKRPRSDAVDWDDGVDREFKWGSDII
jgi:hypothetical protein